MCPYFLPFHGWIISHRMIDHTLDLSIHPPMNVVFCLLSIVDSAARNFWLQVLFEHLLWILLGIHPGLGLMGATEILFTFLRGCQSWPEWLRHSAFPSASNEGSRSFVSSPTLVSSFFLPFFKIIVTLVGVKWWVWLRVCCAFPYWSVCIECPFLGLLAILWFSLDTRPLEVSLRCFDLVTCLVALELWVSLCILEARSLPRIYHLQIFFLFYRLSFPFLDSILWYTKSLMVFFGNWANLWKTLNHKGRKSCLLQPSSDSKRGSLWVQCVLNISETC